MAEVMDRLRQELQLRRLITVTDVVYAIILWRAFMLIPRPAATMTEWTTLGAYFSEYADGLVIIAVGLLVTIIYWGQSNLLLGSLRKTDTKHTALCILQVFFLLLFLYSLRMGIEVEVGAGPRVFESIAAGLVGATGGVAFVYAARGRRLLREELSSEEAGAISDRTLAEPLTALFTVPFAFMGPWLWEAAWLAYPLVLGLLKRRRRSR
jgi:uncharacterized membrane protein